MYSGGSNQNSRRDQEGRGTRGSQTDGFASAGRKFQKIVTLLSRRLGQIGADKRSPNLPPLSTAPAKAARLIMGGLRPKENNGFGLARVIG
jgi:hypothetical protein